MKEVPCGCYWSPKTFHCPLCRRDVCWCQGCASDDGLDALCDECRCEVEKWPEPRQELLRRELAYWQSGKVEDAELVDEMLVRPSGMRWIPKHNGDVWVLASGDCALGRIWWSSICPGTREAFLPWSGECVHRGALADCSFALVAAVRGEP